MCLNHSCLARTVLLLRGFGNVWGHSCCHSLEGGCYWRLLGKGQECTGQLPKTTIRPPKTIINANSAKPKKTYSCTGLQQCHEGT